MRVRVLGAHNQETLTTRLTCLLVDERLALDAGGLTSTLSLGQQEKIDALLLTHRHYDHVRDLPMLALNTLLSGKTLQVFGLSDTLDRLRSHYPDFTARPEPSKPRVRLNPVEPGLEFSWADYRILPLAVPHGPPAVGYRVTSSGGSSFFYSGDTGPGLAEALHKARASLLLLEVTFPNSMERAARSAGHLTPALLEAELQALASSGGPLPRKVLAVHMTPGFQAEIEGELSTISERLGLPVLPASEGMTLQVPRP